MDVNIFFDCLDELGGKFFTGVPDSLLAPFIDGIVQRHGTSENHIVAANEGSAMALATGHYLATAKPAVVYMQNSGIGNAVNPICSLLHEDVYSIPSILVIGWRGEPGTADELQHVFQGKSTLAMLDCLQIPYVIVSTDTDLQACVPDFQKHLLAGKSVAFVIRKNAFSNKSKVKYSSVNTLCREDAVRVILNNAKDTDIFVCTTGKLSREVFEIREQNKEGHKRDFLTVGSMGHSLMIAYGIALKKSELRCWCLDGDGAMLMHMGSMVTVGDCKNLIHVVINNGAHETVGGLPIAGSINKLSEIARALGYKQVFTASTREQLQDVLAQIAPEGSVFIEVLCNLESRADLGRPTTTPIQNRDEFMTFLQGAD